ncbi:hypothetical protein BXO407_04460, partial [Xanthomonas oryzae pv. oryzae]
MAARLSIKTRAAVIRRSGSGVPMNLQIWADSSWLSPWHSILSLEGAHMLGPRRVRSQALRLRRLDIAANAGAAYLMLNHFGSLEFQVGCRACGLNVWKS